MSPVRERNSLTNLSDGGVASLLEDNIKSAKKQGKRSFLLSKDLDERIVEDVVNDDEVEKRKRKEEAELLEKQRAQKEIVTAPTASPFNLLSNLTPSELEEHYSQCIRMCNQNKVNPKNAFKLQLIDYMKLILETRNKKTENLSLMSCTLDASAKIYSCRVDKVYLDMLKIVSGKQWDTEDEDNENLQNDENRENDGETTPKKRKKSDKADTEDDIDLEKMLWSEARLVDKGEVESEITNWINYGRTPLPSNAELFLDCPFSNLTGQLSLNCQLFNTEESIPSNNVINIPKYKGSFCSLDLAKKLPGYSDIYDGESDISIPVDNNLVYDKDSHLVPDTLRLEENEDDMARHDERQPDYDDYMSDEDVQDPTPSIPLQNSNPTGQLSVPKLNSFSVRDMAKLVTARHSDYTFFDNSLLDFMAGPVHWSIKNKRQKTIKPADAPKTVKKEKKIDFSLKNISTIRKIFNDNKGQTLASRTIKLWCKTNYSIPANVYNQRDIISLVRNKNLIYLSNEFKYGLYKNNNNDMNNLNQSFSPDNFNDDAVGECDADGDLFSDDDHNHDDIDHSILNNEENITTMENGEKSQKSICSDLELVPAPPMVNVTSIKFAKAQKKIDIKLLKTTMWDCMQLERIKKSTVNNEECSDMFEEGEENLNSNEIVHDEIKLSDVLKVLPAKLPEEEANQLSFGTVYMALLHMANEKNLQLTGNENYDDVIIKLD